MKDKAIMEKLYLEKSGTKEKDIFVESPTLPQHHINALRFIYSQYKKKNPGIILNDPEGYGKTVEVVLFVNAMKHLLKQPVLIICNDDEVDVWLDNFRKFTNISEEVSVNPSNPFIKGKKVLIATWGEFVSFHVRSWSMLVIHNDGPKKELFKYNFNTEFKIWVTSNDMMEDLDSFIAIYEWLHPSDDISLIQHNGTALERAIHLDAFMKDVVIRSTGYQALGIKKMDIDIEKNNRKVKNKDITGKKLKRSKKTVNEPEIDALIEPIVKEESCHPKDRPSTIKNVRSGHNSNRLVENSGTIKRINKLGQRNESKNVNNENVHLNEIIKVENAESIETVDISENILNNNDVMKVNGDIDDDDDDSQNIRLEYTETNSVRNEMDVDESPSILYINSTKHLASKEFNDEVSDEQSEVLVDNDNANSLNDTDVKVVDNEMACKCSSDIFDSSSHDVKHSNEKSKTTEKLTEFDYKMEEMENKALKKFKGSLLDKLF